MHAITKGGQKRTNALELETNIGSCEQLDLGAGNSPGPLKAKQALLKLLSHFSSP